MYLLDFKEQLEKNPEYFFITGKKLVSDDTDHYHTILLIESDYKDLEKRITKGTISKDDASTEKNNIKDRIFKFISALEAEGVIKPIVSNNIKSKINEADLEKRLKQYKSDKILHETAEGVEISKRELRLLIKSTESELRRLSRLSDCEIKNIENVDNIMSINSVFEVEDIILRISSCVGLFKKAQVTIEKTQKSENPDNVPSKETTAKYLYELFFLAYCIDGKLCWWSENEDEIQTGFQTKELAKYLSMTIFNIILEENGY